MTYSQMTVTACALVLLTLSSCSVGPDYNAPDTTRYEGQWLSESGATSTSAPAQVAWWEIFKDPLLSKYIEAAATHNKNVEESQANLLAARAARAQAGASFLPSIDASGQGVRGKSGGGLNGGGTGGNIRNVYDAGFDASWEIDIFGGNRRTYEAADARTQGALASYQDVLLATLSEVARTYYEVRGLQKQIAITRDNTKLQKETYELIRARLEAGEASEFDLTRAQGEYQLTQSRLPNLEADMKSGIYTLSVLLGQPPESLLGEMQEVKPLPAPPDLVPVGLRSDILRRRPDIRMAERELAASVADIGAQQAELFPKFFLTGNAGSQASTFGDLFTASSGVWSLASLLQWSIFDGGAIRAGIDIQKAESRAAFARYEQSVLEALRDAESALTQYGQELETRQRLEESVRTRRKSVSLAQELLDAGETDYLSVLDAERELTAGENELVLSETRSLTKLIALLTSLGGGWEKFPPK
ncbi:MAG: efflux transporter outer membrane subunit [Pseudobdellovibrionaceae bacterium]